jgi:hypothetical protein
VDYGYNKVEYLIRLCWGACFGGKVRGKLFFFFFKLEVYIVNILK